MAPQGDHGVRGGHLDGLDTAPETGERTVTLARGAGFAVEQILSGTLAAPVEYLQDHDEWAVVLAGSAVVEVDDESHELHEGDWLLLPAGIPHRLVATAANTAWLAVRSTR